MPTDTHMDIGEIRSRLTHLHREAGQLMREVLHTRPTLDLALRRGAIRDLEERLDSHMSTFVLLDEEFIRHTTPPSDINSAMRLAAEFTLHGALRDSVRGLLVDAAAVLGSIRN